MLGFTHLFIRSSALFGVIWLGACGTAYDTLAPLSAQPKTPVSRNLTSFSPALFCMDRMLAEVNRPQIKISSTEIPDHTKKISVGGDDMLVNALNRMNRQSRAYVFLDQARIKDSGIIELLVDDVDYDGPQPQYYIRGSISQLDSDTRRLSTSASFDPETDVEYGLPDASVSRGASVVTVDLHLIAYPSRIVLPGASVSNSMVVRRRGFGTGMFGRITKGTLGVTLQIDRLESTGQAVRNLIELGLIELLGRHAQVPYWECLSLEADNPGRVAWMERGHVSKSPQSNVREAQRLLVELGLANIEPTGRLNKATKRALARFQAENGLIASGRPDFDTIRALRKRMATLAARPRPQYDVVTAPVAVAVSSPTEEVPADPDGYISLNEFLVPN